VSSNLTIGIMNKEDEATLDLRSLRHFQAKWFTVEEIGWIFWPERLDPAERIEAAQKLRAKMEDVRLQLKNNDKYYKRIQQACLGIKDTSAL
jgi:hypothetical protein